MKNKSIAGIIVLVTVVVIGLAVFGVFTPTGNTVKTENRQTKEFAIQSFTETIDGKYYPQFSQKEISVNKGDFVRIKIKNTKGMHDFKIDEFGVYTETPLNKERTVEFVADKAGSFEYYCTKPGHKQNGQWGTLKVN